MRLRIGWQVVLQVMDHKDASDSSSLVGPGSVCVFGGIGLLHKSMEPLPLRTMDCEKERMESQHEL